VGQTDLIFSRKLVVSHLVLVVDAQDSSLGLGFQSSSYSSGPREQIDESRHAFGELCENYL